jgi:phospholipid transport system transporter-binding protein
MIRCEGKRLIVDGPVKMGSVADLLQQSRPLFLGGCTELDLSGLKEADSAALALLLELRRVAKAEGACLKVKSLPKSLEILADLYGTREILEL